MPGMRNDVFRFLVGPVGFTVSVDRITVVPFSHGVEITEDNPLPTFGDNYSVATADVKVMHDPKCVGLWSV